MCGIAGFLLNKDLPNDFNKKNILSMIRMLSHRGPDNEEIWNNQENKIFFGHRRLSILDLSNSGNQPMHSSTGRFTITFNGEIYNHLDIRNLIKNESKTISWIGTSDTETLLAAIEVWGIEITLQKCIGMFSLALWDNKNNKLTLARDRMGEKPLYYGWVENNFVFASELKALVKYPNFKKKICKNALTQYLKLNYIPAPLSIYENIYKLEPATLLHIDNTNFYKKDFELKKYWVLEEVIQSGQKNILPSEQVALKKLEECLIKSVHSQMLSDVPLGAFLSGGIDSSLISALMQSNSNLPVKTFTVGFEESGYDESNYALSVSKHLRTAHSEVIVTNKDAMTVIPKLSEMYDEPFADSSQIPTYLICCAAKKKVTVALTGDGSDEIFGGYNSYNLLPSIWKKTNWIPFSLRRHLGKSINVLSIDNWDRLSKFIKFIFTDKILPNHLGRKLYKLKKILRDGSSFEEFSDILQNVWEDPLNLIKNNITSNLQLRKNNYLVKDLNFLDLVSPLMYQDCISYLPDDILTKVDRAAMFTSLETRVPFLDHNVVSLSWQLPMNMKIRNGQTKWALRQILYKYVPKNLIDRPKSGFEIPLSLWLKGPLKEWSQNLLNKSRIDQEGIFNSEMIEKTWNEHMSGEYNWSSKLWSILMFQCWYEKQKIIN